MHIATEWPTQLHLHERVHRHVVLVCKIQNKPKKSHKSVVIFLNSLAIRLTSVDEIIGVDEMDVATLEIADADQCRTDLIALADLHLGLGSSVEYQTHHRHFNGDQLPLQSIEIVKN